VVGFVVEQRRTPFIEKYEHGKYVPLLKMCDLIRARVGPDERVLAPMAPMMTYITGRQVLSQREVLPRRGSVLQYPQALFDARLNYAVFPAALYRVKEPFVARLMERNLLYSFRKIGQVSDSCYLSRVRVRVPPGDWRDLPKGWKPPEATPKKKKPTTKRVVKRKPASRPARPARRAPTTRPTTRPTATSPRLGRGPHEGADQARRAMTTMLSPALSFASGAVASALSSHVGVERITSAALSTSAWDDPFDEAPVPFILKNARAAGPASPTRLSPRRRTSDTDDRRGALWYENARSTTNPLRSSSFDRFDTLNR
jgi:hypothetical protein